MNTTFDPILGELRKLDSGNDYTTAEKNKLAAITGTNTGNETASSIVALGIDEIEFALINALKP